MEKTIRVRKVLLTSVKKTEVGLSEDSLLIVGDKTYVEVPKEPAEELETKAEEVLRRMHLGDIRAIEQAPPSVVDIYKKHGYSELTVIEDFQNEAMLIVAKFKDVEQMWMDYLQYQEESND